MNHNNALLATRYIKYAPRYKICDDIWFYYTEINGVISPHSVSIEKAIKFDSFNEAFLF